MNEALYINGKAHGITKWYYESGKLNWEEPWVDGEIHGIVKEYYESGKLKREMPWVNGKERLDLLKKENRLERLILIGV